jgi:hypothetical protein
LSRRDFLPMTGFKMPMRDRVRVLPLLVAIVAALAGAAPAGAVTVGIADNKPDMFSDPRFVEARVATARLSVGWDALSSGWQLARLDAWLGAARAAGVEPLVSFGHSPIHRHRLPTVAQYMAAFRRFHARYPWVRDFATWNEANHCGEMTCHRPRLVASWFRRLRVACRGCRVLAAEVLDMPNMVSWVREFRRAARVEPRYWGLHNYVDANRGHTSGTRRLLGAVKGEVWFTETGGIVSRTNRRKITFPESAQHAAVATRFLFRRLVPLSRRITRVYIYQWNITRRKTTWDSALIGPNGRPRPAYAVVRAVLRKQAGARPALG